MKAAVIHQLGDPDVIKYEDVPTPLSFVVKSPSWVVCRRW